ncbi:single-stranded DNA-specific exonuclease [Candidatus Scalindua japonica]|uniref:Single-stranded DNA-specific exonuclease n=2 Tax=Candidatus Scalindua japonica TaxID=1284222 RepID=A0A286TX33_9BACT|nr:single-stranded DNA-specific exonuclease [Candidatus Scalindua japonica]
MAKDWIEKNIPRGSHILLQGKGSTHGVIPLNESKVSLYRRFLRYKAKINTIQDYHGNALKTLEIKMKNIREPSYNIEYFYCPDRFLRNYPGQHSIEIIRLGVLTISEYKKIGFDYVVVSREKTGDNYSLEEDRVKYPAFYNFFRSLENECRLVKTFQYEDSLIEFRKNSIHPEVKIYRLHGGKIGNN